jgi:hypothetical protein
MQLTGIRFQIDFVPAELTMMVRNRIKGQTPGVFSLFKIFVPAYKRSLVFAH